MKSEVILLVTLICVATVTTVVAKSARETGSDNQNPAQPPNVESTLPPPGDKVKTTTPTASNSSCSGGNGTECNTGGQTITGNIQAYITQNKGMLMRSFYVLIGVTGIVIVYFIIRTVRTRRRKSKSKKYGVIATSGSDNLEMTPLDQDDDDEDLTVFEVNGRR